MLCMSEDLTLNLRTHTMPDTVTHGYIPELMEKVWGEDRRTPAGSRSFLLRLNLGLSPLNL